MHNIYKDWLSCINKQRAVRKIIIILIEASFRKNAKPRARSATIVAQLRPDQNFLFRRLK